MTLLRFLLAPLVFSSPAIGFTVRVRSKVQAQISTNRKIPKKRPSPPICGHIHALSCVHTGFSVTVLLCFLSKCYTDTRHFPNPTEAS